MRTFKRVTSPEPRPWAGYWKGYGTKRRTTGATPRFPRRITSFSKKLTSHGRVPNAHLGSARQAAGSLQGQGRIERLSREAEAGGLEESLKSQVPTIII